MSNAGRGLTMVEVLAATLVLAAVAASTVAALRDARGASARAALMRDALGVLERWAGVTRAADDEAPWRWTDERGRAWVVRAERIDAAPARGGGGAGGGAAEPDEPRLDVAWLALRVETIDAAGAPVVALTRVRPVFAPPEAQRTDGGAR